MHELKKAEVYFGFYFNICIRFCLINGFVLNKLPGLFKQNGVEKGRFSIPRVVGARCNTVRWLLSLT